MGKDPAILFYTSDFLSGTSFFTDEEVGKYIRLLCQQHQLGHIPENHMKNICCSLDSPVMKKFTRDDNGCYYNERMEEEAIKRASYCESRGNNRKGKKKKKSYDKPHEEHMSPHMENGNDNEDINEDKDEDKNEKYVPMAEGLKTLVIQHCPTARIGNVIKSWANDFRLMVERDGRTEDEIRDIVRRVFHDSFWCDKIRSAKTLREKWNEGKLNRLKQNKVDAVNEIMTMELE